MRRYRAYDVFAFCIIKLLIVKKLRNLQRTNDFLDRSDHRPRFLFKFRAFNNHGSKNHVPCGISLQNYNVIIALMKMLISGKFSSAITDFLYL